MAAIAFPLIAKTLLRLNGQYKFTNDDEVQENAFETLADTADFLRPPDNQQGGLDSHWNRARQKVQHEIRVAEAVKALGATRDGATEH